MCRELCVRPPFTKTSLGWCAWNRGCLGGPGCKLESLLMRYMAGAWLLGLRGGG